MTGIILIPAVVCWLVLATGSARKALLNAYLPALLLLPQYYELRLKHLPPLTFAEAAIIPLGIALLATGMRRWRLAWMDLWILLFAVCAGLSEALSTELANGDWLRFFSPDFAASQRLSLNLADGVYMFVAGVFTVVMPYMVGKLLIESQSDGGVPMRRKLVERMAVLLAIVALISVHDFLIPGSLWEKMGKHVFPAQTEVWVPQVRWGFGRIAGPYSHAILAGMIFLMGVVYCLWLFRTDPRWGARRVLAGLPFTLRGLVLAGVVAGALMTQSRGPWIGAGLALVFVFLTQRLSMGKAVAVFLVVVGLFGVAAYEIGNRYTGATMRQASSEEQRSAVYRRELLSNYGPVVEQHPAFGWGITTYPRVDGQDSIDNEFLLLAVTEGLVGMGVFVAIVAGSALKLVRLMGQPLGQEDRLLVYAHLAVLIGLTTTLTTVYMGEQVVMLFFLFAGWVQAMRPVVARAQVVNPLGIQVGFRRVLA
jgi:hypothetical protein